MKNVWISGIMSFVFPGLGHMYLGRIRKGLLFIGLNIISILLTANIFGVLLFLAVWFFAILDSIKSTKKINSLVMNQGGTN